jgi:hypothetical protein
MSNGLGNTGVYSLAVNGSFIFAGTDTHGVYYTTNNGINWMPTSLNNQTVLALMARGSYLLAGVLNVGVYVTTNNGLNWNHANLNDRSVNAFAVIGSYIYAGTSVGTFSYGVYKSSNNGLNWSPTLLNNRVVYSLATDPNYNINNIFAGTYGFGVYSIIVNNNIVLAGTEMGVYKSTNTGINWIQTNLNNTYAYSLVLNDNNVFTGTVHPNSFSVSTDIGNSWTQRNEGLNSSISVNALILKNNILYAGATGSSGNGVYTRSLSELIGISPISSEVPNSYSLYQNYPNPFNPVTKIKFSLPSPSKGGVMSVKLVVYDVLGQEIANLIPPLRGGQEGLAPGTYEVKWDGTNYPSGVYFYKLITSDFIQTRKMVLIK